MAVVFSPGPQIYVGSQGAPVLDNIKCYFTSPWRKSRRVDAMSPSLLHNPLLITEQLNCHSEKADAFNSNIIDTAAFQKRLGEGFLEI